MPEIPPFNPPAGAISFGGWKVSFPALLGDLVWRTGWEEEEKVRVDIKD